MSRNFYYGDLETLNQGPLLAQPRDLERHLETQRQTSSCLNPRRDIRCNYHKEKEKEKQDLFKKEDSRDLIQGHDRIPNFFQQSDTMMRMLSHVKRGYTRMLNGKMGNCSMSVKPSIYERQKGGGHRRIDEDEETECSEEDSSRCVNFVDIYYRKEYYELMGMPLTPLEIFSMDFLRTKEVRPKVEDQYDLDRPDPLRSVESVRRFRKRKSCSHCSQEHSPNCRNETRRNKESRGKYDMYDKQHR